MGTPSTLADALAQVAVIAAPGSSCPPAALQSLERAEQSLGGRFYLVHCGEYADDHPLAGKPALGLLQMLLVAVRPDQSGASPYRLKHMPVAVYAFQQPEDMESPMVYLVMYELGADGWPTGAAYSSATAFEKITTKKAGKKVLNTVRFLLDGFDAKSIGVFFNRELLPRDVAVVPKQLTPLLGLWSHDRLAAAGVEVMLNEDPISRRMRANMAEELAYQQAAAAAAGEQGGAAGQAPAVEQGGAPGQQAPGAAVPPPSPPRTRVRRSRKTT